MRPHGHGIDLQSKSGWIQIRVEMPCLLSFLDRARQRGQPLPHGFDNRSANGTWAAIKLERCGRKETSTGKNLIFHMIEPSLQKLPKARHSGRLRERGTDYPLLEDLARHFNRG